METYKISTLNKKSVEEILIWEDERNRQLTITVCWRWGSVFAKLYEEDIAIINSLTEDDGADMYDEFSAELDYLDDGRYRSCNPQWLK